MIQTQERKIQTQNKKGFTLIELLVVLAIIGILFSILSASLSIVRSKSRDARRIADVKQIQSAIENYFSACYTFPENLTDLVTVNPLGCSGYTPVISLLPTDPQTGTNFFYFRETSSSETKKYHLCTTLENSYGNNKGKSGTKNVVTGDGCDGTVDTTFDVVGGAI